MIAGPVNECERCKVQLLPGREVWLELSIVTGLYYKSGNVSPVSNSQGVFPFGAACARRALADTAEEMRRGQKG